MFENSMIKRKYNLLAVLKTSAFSEEERFNTSITAFYSGVNVYLFNIIFINRKMPSVYHENCGKPGPKSIDYLPPPEARIFKSRSAPNPPLLGERRPLFPRASPRLTRGLSQLSDKTAGSKPTKSAKVGRSKSFHGKGMC